MYERSMMWGKELPTRRRGSRRDYEGASSKSERTEKAPNAATLVREWSCRQSPFPPPQSPLSSCFRH